MALTYATGLCKYMKVININTANLLHETNKYKYYKQLFTDWLENKDIRCIHLKERKGKVFGSQYFKLRLDKTSIIKMRGSAYIPAA